MKNKILLFASDMDGTLLGEDFTISPGNLAALQRLEEVGIQFVAATGRTHYDAVTICGRHSLKPYIISNNGACVFDPDGKQLFGRELEPGFVAGLVDYLEREKVCYGLGESEGYIAPENWAEVFDQELSRLRKKGMAIPEEKAVFAKHETQMQNGMRMVGDVREYLKRGEAVYSISLVTYDEEVFRKVRSWISGYQGTAVCVSGTHNAEVMYQDCTKGQSLEFLCQYLGIPLASAAVAGDSLNDLEMFKKAGLGFAMGNARKEIKEAADRITAACREDGVAEAIDWILADKGRGS